MKILAFIITIGILAMGCYVPMPSVGVKPTRIQHVKTCKHTPDGRVECVHTQKWVKN